MPHDIALIGCGAIAQKFYLPALAKHRTRFGRVWLVDPSDHARSEAANILSGDQAGKLADIRDDIRLAIVAAPNALHFSLACEALARGTDVLLEKPFVVCPAEGRKLIEIAAATERVIAINQTRRFLPIARLLRDRISTGEFGRLKSIVHREGTRLTWPFESGAGFERGAERTGVIMDFGVHVIDFYHYLLGPQWKFISATHDGFCGPEGLAEMELEANGALVSIRLSRYHDQENVAHMTFERGEVSFDVFGSGACSVRWTSGKTAPITSNGTGDAERGSLAEQVLMNFLGASDRRERAVCDACSSMPVIELLDEIYDSAGQYSEALGAV